MAIPPIREDGYLPDGVHGADVEEVRQRFGSASVRRRELMKHVDLWVELAHAVAARRLLLDGSFVIQKHSPNDVDAVILLLLDFGDRLRDFDSLAWELRDCIHYGHPAELFLAFDEQRWQQWIDYFSQVRGHNQIRKGLIEVVL